MKPPTSPPLARPGRVAASPRAPRALREQNLTAEAWPGRGSGPSGRIVEKDVRSGQVTPVPKEVQIRRAIARATVQSATTIPHYFLQTEADLTELVALKPEWEKRFGTR